MWAWGELSATKLQKLAACATMDGSSHADVIKLSQIGNSGAAPGNCHRDLSATLSASNLDKAASTIVVKTPVRKMVTKTVEQKILLPHEVFACLWEHYREDFVSRLLGGGDEKVAEFWRLMETHPLYNNHSVSTSKAKHKVVPLSLHGDGVAVTGLGKTWGKSCDCWSWCSLLGSGSTLQFNFLIFLRPKLGLCQSSVLELWRLLAWSFQILAVGRWPLRDHNDNVYARGTLGAARAGKVLAGGYSGVLWSVKGDLEYYSSAMDLPNPNSLEPCVLCKANSTNAPWTDAKPSAKWLKTIWGNAAWRRSKWAKNAVLCLPEVGVLSIAADVMHVKHLGTDQWFCGSILSYICGGTDNEKTKEKLEELWEKIQKVYKEQKTHTHTQKIRHLPMTVGQTLKLPSKNHKNKTLKLKKLPNFHVRKSHSL